ncbi:MAG: hypothetical protein ACYDDA_13570 [Acidiferrobacteraceae bacterium]
MSTILRNRTRWRDADDMAGTVVTRIRGAGTDGAVGRVEGIWWRICPIPGTATLAASAEGETIMAQLARKTLQISARDLSFIGIPGLKSKMVYPRGGIR